MSEAAKPLGFWSCWALVVGCMIGSGVFMLPALLAEYGMLSFGGWMIAGAGSIALALVFARLAARTSCDGGPYAYSREAFGDLTGFLMGWVYWISYCLGIPVVAIAFVGYLGVFIPALNENAVAQAGTALALIAALTAVNVRGLREMSFTQIALTLLKIIPLLAIVGLAFPAGSTANLPTFNPSGEPIFSALAASALVTLWAFTGFEVATLPATNVKNCARTIPRALVTGMLTVVVIYLSATFAVMLLVPAETLETSTAPFAEAARAFGPWGDKFIAAGALIATAGTLNGLIFTSGQMPAAIAMDRLAPRLLATTNEGGAPYIALIISAVIASVLLATNYSRGLLGAFEFLLKMATSISLFYYLASAVAEMRYSWRSAKAWASVGVLAAAYSLFALYGSGLEVFLWGLLLTALGVPLYFLGKQPKASAAAV